MDKVKTVALVAHDNRKADLTEWVAYNAGKLAMHHLVCTGTTGKMVEETLARSDRILTMMHKASNFVYIIH